MSTLALEDARLLDRVVGIVEAAARAEVVAVYLFGSATSGGLRPRSDLDVFAVVRQRLARAAKERIARGLLPLSGRQGNRHVEVTIVAQPDVRPWRFPPSMDFQYGDWLRDEIERGEDAAYEARANADLAALITMVRQTGRTLAGPPPDEVLPDVPWDDLVRGTAGQIHELLPGIDDETDTRNSVLTLARIWATLETGDILSKDAAAEWALPRLVPEHRAVLSRARAIYLGEEQEHWDDLRTCVRPFADHVIEICRDHDRGAPLRT